MMNYYIAPGKSPDFSTSLSTSCTKGGGLLTASEERKRTTGDQVGAQPHSGVKPLALLERHSI